jgi:HNH endonuclease
VNEADLRTYWREYRRAYRAGLRRTKPPLERFWSKVTTTDTCWLWTGSRDTLGYANFALAGGQVRAHRFAYELLVGPIPVGLELDHLCAVRHCVRPAHLKPVTHAENVRRAVARRPKPTHCGRGHRLTPENVRIVPRGGGTRWVCRACQRFYTAAYRARRAA